MAANAAYICASVINSYCLKHSHSSKSSYTGTLRNIFFCRICGTFLPNCHEMQTTKSMQTHMHNIVHQSSPNHKYQENTRALPITVYTCHLTIIPFWNTTPLILVKIHFPPPPTAFQQTHKYISGSPIHYLLHRPPSKNTVPNVHIKTTTHHHAIRINIGAIFSLSVTFQEQMEAMWNLMEPMKLFHRHLTWASILTAIASLPRSS